MEVLQRGISLPNSLATLHDAEEGRRLNKRVRPLGADRHPYVRLGHIAAGKIYIPTSEFVIKGRAPHERILLKPDGSSTPNPNAAMCPMVRQEDENAAPLLGHTPKLMHRWWHQVAGLWVLGAMRGYRSSGQPYIMQKLVPREEP